MDNSGIEKQGQFEKFVVKEREIPLLLAFLEWLEGAEEGC